MNVIEEPREVSGKGCGFKGWKVSLYSDEWTIGPLTIIKKHPLISKSGREIYESSTYNLSRLNYVVSESMNEKARIRHLLPLRLY